MAETLSRGKRFSVIAAGIGLALLTISGAGCMSSSAGPAGSVAGALPAAESKYHSYVTPESQSVQDTLRDIFGGSPYQLTQTGLNDIRDWVADNIVYESDEPRWGEDYWQTPEETLLYRTGDCEDYSILLCSLFRAYGIDAGHVFVALGDDGQGEGHAFVIEDWGQDGDWQRIEPQSPAQVSSLAWLDSLTTNPDAELDKYDITAAFNDRYYYDNNDGSFSWMDEQANVWILTNLVAAMQGVVNGLSRVAEYLFGLLFG